MHHNSLDDGGKDRYGRDAASVRYVPQAAERPPHAAYDTALLDLDGVVYAGERRCRTRWTRWARRARAGCGWRT